MLKYVTIEYDCKELTWLLPSQWISSTIFVQVRNNFWISWKLKRKLSSERDHHRNWHQFQRLNLWILWWKLLVLMHFWWHYVLADIFSHHITFWCLKHKFNIALFFLGLKVFFGLGEKNVICTKLLCCKSSANDLQIAISYFNFRQIENFPKNKSIILALLTKYSKYGQACNRVCCSMS